MPKVIDAAFSKMPDDAQVSYRRALTTGFETCFVTRVEPPLTREEAASVIATLPGLVYDESDDSGLVNYITTPYQIFNWYPVMRDPGHPTHETAVGQAILNSIS